MLDIKFIRENKDIVLEGARKKHIKVDMDGLIKLDDKRRELLAKVEEKRKIQNDMNQTIVSEKDSTVKLGMIETMRQVKEDLQKEEEEFRDLMKKWQMLMVQVPNVPDISVPEGESDADNKEIKTWGEIPKFDFTPKDHVALMNALGIADFERGTKVSGFRGYFLKGDGALLNMALWNFTMDHFLAKGGFTPMFAPSLLRREPFMGTGYLPQSEDDLYKTQDGEYLSGTAEVGAMGYHMDEIVPRESLPIKYLAFSPCFRREAGSHSKDIKGLYRVHEFFKLEQIVLCEANHGVADAKWKCPKCGSGMIIKLGKNGRFLSCEKFPDCMGARTLEGEEMAGPKDTGELCPECGKSNLFERDGKYGRFIACGRYPKCKFVKDDPEAKKKLLTGVKCPVCGDGEMMERRGRFGIFYSCTNYPKCKNAIKAKPTGDICTLCGSLMMEGTKTIPVRCSNKACANHNPHKLMK